MQSKNERGQSSDIIFNMDFFGKKNIPFMYSGSVVLLTFILFNEFQLLTPLFIRLSLVIL